MLQISYVLKFLLRLKVLAIYFPIGCQLFALLDR